MNTDELVIATRISGALPDADPTYTDDRIREELHNALTTAFSRTIVNSRQGYWRKNYDIATEADRKRYRVPPRAVAGAVESVETFPATAEPSQCYPTKQSYRYEGDQLELSTYPSGSDTLRMRYYIRPSRLVDPQAADVGVITAVNRTTRTLTVPTGAILNQVTGDPLVVGDKVDIIHPNGWFELALVNGVIGAYVTGAPNDTITLTTAQPLTDVEIGDYIRAADQTDWPCLPEDFHRTLADAAALAIVLAKGDLAKAQALSQRVSEDVQRLLDLLSPRTMDTPRAAVPRSRMIGGRAIGWGRGWR